VLIPRIMRRTVGVSALVSLLAILAFGTLYGVLGVLIAIPMAAVFQVLLDSLVINVEPVVLPTGLSDSPWVDLRTRAQSLGQQARARLRSRTSRMGIDPTTEDHQVDALDQQIEVAVARLEKLISAAEQVTEPWAMEARSEMVENLQKATVHIELAVESVDAIASGDEHAIPGSLGHATQRFEEAVEDATTLMGAAQATSIGGPRPP
jgi:hypothetical protein